MDESPLNPVSEVAWRDHFGYRRVAELVCRHPLGLVPSHDLELLSPLDGDVDVGVPTNVGAVRV
jgi:hypothetical protein